MYGYIASHNWGRTLVLSDGRIFEHREQPGGGGRWHQTDERIDAGDSHSLNRWLNEATEKWGADWTELQDDAEIEEEIGEQINENGLELAAIMTPAEIAATWGVKEDTVRDAAQHGWIAARKSGATWLIRRADAEARWGKQKS